MGTIKKRSWLSSALGMKCPRCRKGDLFYTPTFSFKKPFDMPKRCGACDQKYFLQPGFYYGAMFLSYIMTGWFALFLVGISMFLFSISMINSLILMTVVLAILFVWFFRLSRSLWIHLRVSYDEKIAESTN